MRHNIANTLILVLILSERVFHHLPLVVGNLLKVSPVRFFTDNEIIALQSLILLVVMWVSSLPTLACDVGY